MSAQTILIVEDDQETRNLVARYLRENAFNVAVAANGHEMNRYIGQNRVDLIVLDLMLPGEDGLSLCRRLRVDSATPIIILTARGDDVDRILGLEMGADDYVIKPVDLYELGARLRALVRRSHGRPTEQLHAQDVELEPASRTACRAGVPVALSTREFDLLHILMLNAGRVLSREQIEQYLYSWGQEVESNAVEVHIHRLRAKLGSELIRTVRGVGYVLMRGDA